MSNNLLLPYPHDPLNWPHLGDHLIYSKHKPVKSGVYAIYGYTFEQYRDLSSSPDLYYIGESRHICQRLASHDHYGDLRCRDELFHVTVRYIEIGNRKEIERDLIKILRPPLNIQHNGNN